MWCFVIILPTSLQLTSWLGRPWPMHTHAIDGCRGLCDHIIWLYSIHMVLCCQALLASWGFDEPMKSGNPNLNHRLFVSPNGIFTLPFLPCNSIPSVHVRYFLVHLMNLHLWMVRSMVSHRFGRKHPGGNPVVGTRFLYLLEAEEIKAPRGFELGANSSNQPLRKQGLGGFQSGFTGDIMDIYIHTRIYIYIHM